MKKFTTLALAAAMTAAMSIGAFADDTQTLTFSGDVNTNKEEGISLYTIDATGYETATITFDFTDTWGGGAMGYNTVATGSWSNCNDYSNDADTMTYTIDVSDIAADENGVQSFQIQCWWVGDVPYTATLTLSGGAAADATTDATTDTDANDSADGGDVAPVAYLAAVVALAGVAMVASKKVRA